MTQVVWPPTCCQSTDEALVHKRLPGPDLVYIVYFVFLAAKLLRCRLDCYYYHFHNIVSRCHKTLIFAEMCCLPKCMLCAVHFRIIFKSRILLPTKAFSFTQFAYYLDYIRCLLTEGCRGSEYNVVISFYLFH